MYGIFGGVSESWVAVAAGSGRRLCGGYSTTNTHLLAVLERVFPSEQPLLLGVQAPADTVLWCCSRQLLPPPPATLSESPPHPSSSSKPLLTTPLTAHPVPLFASTTDRGTPAHSFNYPYSVVDCRQQH